MLQKNRIKDMAFSFQKQTQKMYQQRPSRYVWPIVLIICLVSVLWAEFPWSLQLGSLYPTTGARRPLSKAAYITIDEASMSTLLKQAASEWMLGSGRKRKKRGLDLTTLETSLEPPAARYLEEGKVLPSEWKPENAKRLPVDLPPIVAPEKNKKKLPPQKELPQRNSYRARLSPSLEKAKFQFQFSTDVLKSMTSPSGHCQFYIECNDQGVVEHIVRLSAAEPDAFIFERVLALGTAKSAASGRVDIEWVVYK
jgi:hypothetical protein